MSITDEQFGQFLQANNICDLPLVIVEDNEAMTGTYQMIDPAGRFFDNTKGYHTYSDPILEIGIASALKQINYDYDEFEKRGGMYEW